MQVGRVLGRENQTCLEARENMPCRPSGRKGRVLGYKVRRRSRTGERYLSLKAVLRMVGVNTRPLGVVG